VFNIKIKQGAGKMRFKNSAILLVAVIIFSSFSVFAQETEPIVIDEVVAQVNDGVITLSRIKRQMKEMADAIAAESKKPIADATADVKSRQGEIIANLINEELILQKGKEIGVDDVDGQINQRFAGMMKEQGVKTLDKFYELMREQGVDPDEIRAMWRRDFVKGNVIQREVTSKIYQALSGKEIKEFFAANKSKFVKPENLTISEIFLSFAGRDEPTIREKAKKLVADIKAGADFKTLALANSERPDIKTTKGLVGSFDVKELNEKISIPLRGIKANGVTEPIELEEGMMILHVDERTEASTEGVFDEDLVRRTIAFERAPAESKKYMIGLRKDAYIKISEGYRALVGQALFEDERTAKTETKPKGK
jgi:peptidyl-prolyl cis-trans isomerase SurA